MRIGALGDIHGEFPAVRAIMARHPDVPFWVSVGDVCDAEGRYFSPPAPLYSIKGNNEHFDTLEALAGGRLHVDNLHYLPNGVACDVCQVRIAGLGGTFAPTWYDTPAGALPRPGPGRGARAASTSLPRDDKRRHFVREEVEACMRLRGLDLLLSHEAPRPFFLQAARGRRLDAGKKPINEVLAAASPHFHLFGHHHLPSEAIREGVLSIGLDLVTRSYVLINTDGWRWERLEHPDYHATLSRSH